MANIYLHILVHAIVHNADEDNRADFYECLNKHWNKIKEHKLSTTWTGTIETESYADAFKAAKESFEKCARDNKVNIDFIIQVGPYQAKVY